jgi:hypothetical protein
MRATMIAMNDPHHIIRASSMQRALPDKSTGAHMEL